MNEAMPRTPFSTALSGSARETELRLRNIFSGPKRRPPAALLILTLAVCVLCGNLVSCRGEKQPEEITLSMRLQYYDKLGNYLEVPALSGAELPEALAAVDEELEEYTRALQSRLKELNTSNEEGYLRCLCFPSVQGRYLSLLLFQYDDRVYYISDGPEMRSWVWDREEERLVTPEEALAAAGTTLEALKMQILRQHNTILKAPEHLDLMGFRLDGEGTPTLYLNAWSPLEDGGRVSYQMEWSQGELMQFYADDLPFLSQELDELDPPLYHQWYAGWDSQPPNGFSAPPINQYTIAKLLAVEGLGSQMNTWRPAPEPLASRTAGRYTLLLIRQDSGVHAGGNGNLVLGVWDNDAQKFEGDIWCQGGDVGQCSFWEEDGVFYLVCANSHRGSGWESSAGLGWFRFDERGLEQLTALPGFAREAMPGLPGDEEFFDCGYGPNWWDNHKAVPAFGGVELFARNQDYNASLTQTYQWDYLGFLPLTQQAAEYAPAARFLRERLWAEELKPEPDSDMDLSYAAIYGPYLYITGAEAAEEGWRFEITNRYQYWDSNGFPDCFEAIVAVDGQSQPRSASWQKGD